MQKCHLLIFSTEKCCIKIWLGHFFLSVFSNISDFLSSAENADGKYVFIN